MERLLDSLLVPHSDGLLVPASSQQNGDSSGHFENSTMLGDSPHSGESLVSRPKPGIDLSTSTQEPTVEGTEAGAYEYGGQPMSIEDVEDPNWSPTTKLVSVQAIKADPEVATTFHHACDQRGTIPFFDYKEVLPHQYTAVVTIGPSRVESDEHFSNKRLAKEAVCKLAIPILEDMSDCTYTKRKVSETNTPDGLFSPEVLNGTNWIGILQDYCQLKKLKLPTYEVLQTTKTPFVFACQVKLPIPNAPILGSRTDRYSNKALARKAAAREGVIYLRSQGAIMAEPWIEPVSKRAKLDEVSVASAAHAAHDETHESMPEIQDRKEPNATADKPDLQGTLASQVVNMAISLGLSPPSYHIKPVESEGAVVKGSPFVHASATFLPADVAKQPRLAGAIGPQTGAYGKKKAKETCCEEVLSLLRAIKEDSML